MKKCASPDRRGRTPGMSKIVLLAASARLWVLGRGPGSPQPRPQREHRPPSFRACGAQSNVRRPTTAPPLNHLRTNPQADSLPPQRPSSKRSRLEVTGTSQVSISAARCGWTDCRQVPRQLRCSQTFELMYTRGRRKTNFANAPPNRQRSPGRSQGFRLGELRLSSELGPRSRRVGRFSTALRPVTW